MTGISDFMDLGFFPLQDHASGQDGTPVHARLMIAGGRISRVETPATSGESNFIEYAKEYELGTLGDVHPWMFWQTRERGARGMGSWAQCFGTLAVDADGYYGNVNAQPLRGRSNAPFANDTRYRVLDPAWPVGLSHVPRGALTLLVPGTDEAEQTELALWTDPRIVAPNATGPGECGTLVVDLQPTHELCMDGETRPGMGGRHARIQTLLRVIAVPPQTGFANLGNAGNTIALNFTTTGTESIPNFGAFFGLVDGSGGPTTGGPSGPTTGGPTTGGPSGPTTGGPITGPHGAAALAGVRNVGAGSFGGGGDLGSASGSTEEEFEPRSFGEFAPKPVQGHGIGLMAAMGADGPLHPGAANDKHRHGTDRDGHPINAAHISTEAFFYQDSELDAPIAFEGGYPNPTPLPIPAPAHLSYDGTSSHSFMQGAKSGRWRLWCETPDVTPPPPATPTTGGGPGIQPPTFVTGPGRRPGVQPPAFVTGPGPGVTGPGPGTPGGKPKPTGPITPNPGGKRFPGYPPTGPIKPGGGPTTGGPGSGGPAGPVRPGGSGGQPSVPCKVPPAGPTRPAGGPTRPNGVPPRAGQPAGGSRTGGNGPNVGMPDETGLGAGAAAGAAGSEPRTGRSSGRPGGSPVWRKGGRGLIGEGGDPIETSNSTAVTPSGARLSGSGFILRDGAAGGPGGGGTPATDPRTDLGRWSGMNTVSNTPQQVQGVVERVGEASREEVALYSLFRPMAQGFAAVNFRPQFTVAGAPCFEHNPQLPTPMYFHDEAVRPQVLAMRAWGAQDAASGEWAHVEEPRVSRARGGTGHGGVIFSPPRFELSDYYGIGADVLDVAETASAQATTAYVLAAPGVRYALGLPNADGTLQANGVQIYQPTLASGLSITHDDVEVVSAYKNAASETIVELAQGGTKTGLLMPSGTTANRPTTAAAAGLMRWNTTTSGLEVYDGASWAAVGGGGGGGLITNGDYTVSTGVRVLGRESGAGDIEELQVTNGLQITSGALGFITGVKGDIDIAVDASTLTIVQATLAAIRALTPAADNVPYWTGATTAANTALTATGRAIIGATDTDDAQLQIGLNSERSHVDFQDMCATNAGAAGYTASNSGSGTNVSQGWPFTNASTNAVGVLMLESGTTTSGYSSMSTWNNALRFNTGTAFTFEARLITETLSSAAQEYRLEVGFGDSWSSTWPTDSALFRYDRATDGANWQCITRAGGSETKTDSGIAVNAGTTGTMQILGIEVAADGSSVVFKIAEGTVATHTTRIPTNGGSLGYGAAILKSAGTTEVRVGIDWTRFTTTRTGAR